MLYSSRGARWVVCIFISWSIPSAQSAIPSALQVQYWLSSLVGVRRSVRRADSFWCFWPGYCPTLSSAIWPFSPRGFVLNVGVWLVSRLQSFYTRTERATCRDFRMSVSMLRVTALRTWRIMKIGFCQFLDLFFDVNRSFSLPRAQRADISGYFWSVVCPIL